MLKSLREAHVRSGWANPDEDYEARVKDLVGVALDPAPANGFLAAFQRFEERSMRDGALNGLIATALKLTVPGVPDIYRGAEVWEQSMVDPDNRRFLDFERLQQQLPGPGAPLEELAAQWRDGAVKQALIARLLHLRLAEAALFADGSYEPVEARGPDGERICAFLRRHGPKALLVGARLYPGRDGDTVPEPDLALPPGLPADGWHDMLTTGPQTGPGHPRWASPLPLLIATNFPHPEPTG
jgi:(1->4)-alpha-D-glucan 1-alpha-D-glucosylmutase